MIPVKTFVAQAGIWADVAPLMDSFVRWANTHQVFHAKKVPIGSLAPMDAGQGALLAQLAFELCRDKFLETRSPRALVEATARRTLAGLPGANPDRVLTRLGWLQAESMSASLSTYLSMSSDPVEFSPLIPGCGVVDDAIADVLQGAWIVEVKAVTRGFRASDFRQILSYAAMLHARRFTPAGIVLVNPRTGHHVATSMAFVSGALSGSGPAEFLGEIVECMAGLQVSV